MDSSKSNGPQGLILVGNFNTNTMSSSALKIVRVGCADSRALTEMKLSDDGVHEKDRILSLKLILEMQRDLIWVTVYNVKAISRIYVKIVANHFIQCSLRWMAIFCLRHHR